MAARRRLKQAPAPATSRLSDRAWAKVERELQERDRRGQALLALEARAVAEIEAEFARAKNRITVRVFTICRELRMEIFNRGL
jgi:hypothetical protein